jgi:hypothetical protein
MVGKEQRLAGQRLKKAHPSDGIGLTKWRHATALLIEARLKLRDQLGLVGGGRNDDAAVLRRWNVPLEALKDDDLGTGAPGLDKLAIGIAGHHLLMRRTTVIGNDTEAEAVFGRSLNLLEDLVASVGAVLGVDVVVGLVAVVLGLERSLSRYAEVAGLLGGELG